MAAEAHRLARTLCAAVVLAATLLVPAAAPAQPYVYVSTIGRVYEYSSDLGLLSPLTPPSVLQEAPPIDVAATPDGRSLFAGGRNSITQWDVHTDGTLTPKAVPSISAGQNIVALAVAPDGKSLYAADTGDGSADSTGAVLQFDVGPSGLTPKKPASVPAAQPDALTVSPDSRSVYVDTWIAHVAQFTAAVDGTLSPKTPALAGSVSYSDQLVVSPDGRSMYSFTFGYAPDNDSSKPWPWPGFIEQFDIAADGTMTHKSPSFVHVPTGLGFGLTMSPDGKSLYATSEVGNEISQFDVGTGGLLSLKSTPIAEVPNPTGCCLRRIKLTPDGRAAYVTSSGSSVSELAVNPDGTLSARAEGGGAVLFGEPGNTLDGLAITNGPSSAPAYVVLTPTAGTGVVGQSHTLTAQVTDSGRAPVSNTRVLVSVTGADATGGVCTTDGTGTCSWSYTGPDLPGVDQITACAAANVDGTQGPDGPCGTVSQTWLLPPATAGHITGGGQIPNAAGTGRITIGFEAKSDKNGVKGEGTVVDPSTSTTVKLTDATDLTQTGSRASIFGRATVNGVATMYRLDVADNADPGAGADTFRLDTASGYIVAGTLTNGNIQSH